MTRLAISPRLATRTDSSTPGSLQPGRHPATRNLGECLDDPSVVLDRVEPKSVERSRRLIPVDGPADHVVEGIGGPDDPAAQWRWRFVPDRWPTLAPHEVGHV